MNETVIYEDTNRFHRYFPQWLWQYPDGLSQIWKDVLEHLMLAAVAAIDFLLLYMIIGVLTYIYFAKFSSNKDKGVGKRVLFVIAHPDDECMFFGPTILNLIKNSEVYLLCLSIGNHYKKGHLRKEELYNSCRTLGIPQSNIMVMNNSKMPDDPDVIWNVKKTARILQDHIESFSIEEVYTFDIKGVSGHLNHISVFYAFARMCLSEDIPSGVRVYVLDSVNILRKYSLILDAGLSALPIINERLYIVPFSGSRVVREAMHKHRSQIVWFRAIYIYLSRYMYINTYKELELEDVQLLLQMTEYNPKL